MDPNDGYVVSHPSKTFGFSKRILIISAGLIVAIVTAIALLLSSGGKSTATQVEHLVERMNNLQVLLTDTKTTRNIKNEDLSNIITSFSLTMTTDSNNLATALAEEYPTKIPESIVASEVDTATIKNIEDAYLENKLDAVYADVLKKKIASIRALIAETYGLSNNKKLKAELVKIDDHMRTVSDQLDTLKL